MVTMDFKRSFSRTCLVRIDSLHENVHVTDGCQGVDDTRNNAKCITAYTKSLLKTAYWVKYS